MPDLPTRQQLSALLRSDDTEERCGIFLHDGSIVELPNLAAEPERSFEIDPVALLKFLPYMRGTWHTHPNGPANQSGADHMTFLSWPDMEHVIISPSGVACYRVDNGALVECA